MSILRRAPLPLFFMMLGILVCSSKGDDTPPPENHAGTITWPLRLDSPSGTITVYQPQPEKFDGATLTARAAVSLEKPNTEPEFGAVWLTARVSSDRDARTVTILDITVRRVHLPDASADQEKEFSQTLEDQIPKLNMTFSLDELMTSLSVAEQEKAAAQKLLTVPPRIIFSAVPAVLVTLDGPAKLQATDTPNVMRVINTPFTMLLDMSTKRYFLKAGDQWETAADVTGAWSPTTDVPAAVTDAAVKLQDQAPSSDAGKPGATPKIIVATDPTELIVTDGPATYTPLAGNDLLYMSNTESDVFLEVNTQQYFVLLSGRWYSSSSLQGPWEYVPADKLPESFSRIPSDSEKAHVLASVAGTPQAQDARLDARVPQTAAVRRDSGADVSVTYDGNPDFQPVEGTAMTYAVNSPDPVLCVQRNYYCCRQAVWYQATSPLGAWTVCTTVPSEIYTLPPSCPIYNVRFVYVYDSTPEYVYCGYLPGYTGCYVFGPTVIYGTGYSYPFWYHHFGFPRPHTWGFGTRYDLATASWGFGIGYSWNASWFAHDPHLHHWWGPQGFVEFRQLQQRHAALISDARDNNRKIEAARINLYNRPENARRNVAEPAKHMERIEPRATETHGPAPQNNIYAGHDGRVYRRTNEGWEEHTGAGWNKMKAVPEEPARSPNDEHRALEHPVQTPPAHVEHPAENSPRIERPIEPQRQAPAEPRTPAPAQREPARQAQPAPEQHTFGGGGGLEADHAARQRGAERSAPSAPSGGNNNSGGGNRGSSGQRQGH